MINHYERKVEGVKILLTYKQQFQQIKGLINMCTFTHLPGDDVLELVMTDISFTNKLKMLSLIPSNGHALESSDLSGVSREPPEGLVSMATSPTACSKSGMASSLSKCKLRAISRFPLQALKRFIVAPG